MDFDAVFPLKYLLNLSRRQDRRVRCEELFAAHGWQVRRQPAVDARRLRSWGAFHSAGRYAHAAGTRMILRKAALAGAEAVFIMEDDVVFHPALAERLAELELPDDWGIFYLGCQHHERPEPAGRGVVRVRAALDTHAWGVRREYFLEVRRALAGRYWEWGDFLPAADILLTELARRIPTYAALPNLAWQQEEESDLAGREEGMLHSNYSVDGTTVAGRRTLRGLTAQMLGGKLYPPAAAHAAKARAWFWPKEWFPGEAPEPVEPGTIIPLEVAMAKALAVDPVAPSPPPLQPGGRIAFLFLTRGAHRQPDIWEEYWQGHEERVSVYAHTKERSGADHESGAPQDWLTAAQIGEQVPTEWASVSLVRAQMALLKAALAEEANRFFVFHSESCIPVRPLRDLVRLLEVDGRSRFFFTDMAETRLEHPEKADRAPLTGRIPPGEWYFHSQWILLNREAAELIAANECLIDCFADTFAPDEYAFGTILNAAGYPLEERVAAKDVTWCSWTVPYSPHPATFETVTPEIAGDMAGSGCFFARKISAACEVGTYRLHRE